MLTFKEYLQERILSPGFNKSHNELRDKHAGEIHDIIRKSYAPKGGYGGLKSGSKEESDAIHHDIKHQNLKLAKKNGKIVAAQIYKNQYGRKSVAAGTDGTQEGKDALHSIMKDDHKEQRSWAEVSGAPAHIMSKLGVPKLPNQRAKELTGKDDIEYHPTDPHKYTRKIGNEKHEKVIMGYPKK